MKKLLSRLKKDQRGLTLVELLAVVVILAIVSAIAFVVIGKVIENSKKDAHIGNAQQVISAVKIAEASGDVDFSKTNPVDATKLDTIGSLVNPWNKAKYTKADVSKTNGTYSITLVPDTDCSISGTTEEELQEGRKAVCDPKTKPEDPPAGG